jgi:hypothetical protein
MLLFINFALLLIALDDLIKHVLPDANQELLLILPEVVIGDMLGRIFCLFGLLRQDVLLEDFSGEEAGAFAGHGFNSGDVLVRNFPRAQFAQIVIILLSLEDLAGNDVTGAIKNRVWRLLGSVACLQEPILIQNSINLRRHYL